MDVVKVDRDVACVATVVHVCSKHLFPMFYPFFQTYVANVFIWMLHMFHTYVASILSGRCVCSAMVSSVFRCFCKCFTCMLQVFHLPSLLQIDLSLSPLSLS